MSDSEDDDWFSKDLDEFVAPKVIGKERENKEISIRNHPYQSLIIESEYLTHVRLLSFPDFF